MATKNTKPNVVPPSGPGGIEASSPPTEKSKQPAPSKRNPAKAPSEQGLASPSTEVNVSPAKVMQEQSIAPPEPAKISVTLRTEQSYEYNLDLPREVVEKLLDPDVADGFIEVPAVTYGGQKLNGIRRFLHTSYVKEVDVWGM